MSSSRKPDRSHPWYALEAGETLSVELLFTHELGDIDAQLVDAEGARLAAGEIDPDPT